MADKIYAKGITFKTRQTSFGDVIKIGIKAADFGAFVREHKNEKGFINLDVLPRKEVSEYGETHYAVLDTWKPDGQGSANGAQKPKPAAKKQQAPAKTVSTEDGFQEDDIPF